MTVLHIHVLGSVWVSSENGDVDLGPPKQRAVLALLALHAGRHVRLSDIVDSVWPASAPKKANALVHTYVARLRHILEPGEARRNRTHVIASVPGGYRLTVRDDQLDLTMFRSLAARAVALRETGETEQAFAALGEAVRLWRDPDLTDLHGLLHCEELLPLRQEFVSAALDYLALGLETDHPEHVVPLAERLARAEPLNELIQARTVQVLARGGMRADAMERFLGITSRLRSELGVDPGPELAAAYREVLDGDPSSAAVAPARPSWHGPRPGVESLLGRQDDLDFVTGLVRRYRLVTLTGPAGVGKTALARQAAAELRASFPDGVAVTDLACVRCGDELAGSVLRTLGRESVAQPAAAEAGQVLVDRLHDREMLLVLDNAELVTDEIADLVDDILRAAPLVRILLTTRELLGLAYEAVYPVRPLAVGPAGPDAMRLPALQLFARRAAQVCRGFALTPANLDLVAEICRALDGLPLAIELAAACVRTTNLETLLDDLRDPLHAIRPPRRGDPSHHRSLYAAVRRNLDLLDATEQRCFAALGAVPREFCLDAATRASDQFSSASDTRQLLERLVDKSLLEVWHRNHGPQYRMLGTVHAFARELLHDYRSQVTTNPPCHCASCRLP
ncbi:BTAD domain-containing putative transcriptional regulator [Micromonospora sp. NPDC003776]